MVWSALFDVPRSLYLLWQQKRNNNSLKSVDWFFRFFILDRLSHQAIQLTKQSELPRQTLFLYYHNNNIKVKIPFSLQCGSLGSRERNM
jgi:hypothetical protein